MIKAKIEVITYEEERLNYFTELMIKANKRHRRLFKKFSDAPVLSVESEMLSDAGREAQFHADVVEMLEKGYRNQSEGEWEAVGLRNPQCSLCHKYNFEKSDFCPNCGAKMKGGE